MHTSISLLILVAAHAMAESSKSASIITTTFFNLGVGITPVASIIGVNATSPDLVTYLINCPPSPTSAPTTAPISTPMITSANSYATDVSPYILGPDRHTYTTQPINVFGSCIIPAEGMTLIAGASSMSLAYTNTHTPSDMTKDYDCTVTRAAAAASGTAAAASASASSTEEAGATCDIRMMGMDDHINLRLDTYYVEEDATGMWGPLVVTAGVEKLAAARNGASAATAATGTFSFSFL